MHYRHPLKRIMLYGSWAILGGLFLLILSAFIPRKFGGVSDEPCDEAIYITGDWFHSNLVLPVQTQGFNWEDYLSLTERGTGHPPYQYLSFGWGDRDYYLNTPTLDRLKLSTALSAFFIPTESVLHIQGYLERPLDQATYRAKRIQLSSAHYQQLAHYILNTLLASNYPATPIRHSHRYQGSFYPSQGQYGFWKTCNDWVADGLRQVDVNTPLWSGLAPSVLHHGRTRCQSKTLQ